MGLAGKDDLHRPVGVRDDGLESIHVVQQQRGALVEREAAREPNREHVAVQGGGCLRQLMRRRSAMLSLRSQAAANVGHQTLAALGMYPPKLVVGNGGQASIDALRIGALGPVSSHVALQQAVELA